MKTSKSPGSPSGSENNAVFPEQNFVWDKGFTSIRNRLTVVPYAERFSWDRVHVRLKVCELRTTPVVSGIVSMIGEKILSRRCSFTLCLIPSMLCEFPSMLMTPTWKNIPIFTSFVINSPADQGRLWVHLFQCPPEAPWAQEGPVAREDRVDPSGPDPPVWKRQSRCLICDAGSSSKSTGNRLESPDTLRLKLATEAKDGT